MGTRKVSYMSLLKEAISEFDTSDKVDVKGPFLDPILGYDGGGELPTHKDAASILERYYFKEGSDEGVQVEHKDDVMPEEAPAQDAAVGGLKKKIEKAVADDETPTRDAAQTTKLGEDVSDIFEEGSEVVEEAEEPVEEAEDVELSEAEEMENAVIEKLIGEMEQEIEEDVDLVSEEDFTKDDSGTEPAGLPEKDFEGELPPRKDNADSATKAASIDKPPAKPKAMSDWQEIYEQEEEPAPEEKKEEEGEEELDVDKGVAAAEAALGPIGNPQDAESGEELYEQFQIFKEAMEDEEDAPAELDSDEIRV